MDRVFRDRSVVAPRWHHVFSCQVPGIARCKAGSIPASAQRDSRTSQRFCLAIGCSHLQRIQPHSGHFPAGQDRCSCWIMLMNFDRSPSLRSWGSRVRIAPGSPFGFAHLADLLLRALRIGSPNQTEPFPSTVYFATSRRTSRDDTTAIQLSSSSYRYEGACGFDGDTC